MGRKVTASHAAKGTYEWHDSRLKPRLAPVARTTESNVRCRCVGG